MSDVYSFVDLSTQFMINWAICWFIDQLCPDEPFLVQYSL